MTLLSVVDTETTGITETDQVCEIAVCRVEDDGTTFPPWTRVVRPTCEMSIGARATHHITDAELKKAGTMAEVMDEFVGNVTSDVFVAHSADFDRGMLLQSGVPASRLPSRTICTWRCALHLCPDSPGHSNQVLRYYLGLKIPDVTKLPPHRALPDAVVTAQLLIWMLGQKTVDELVELTSQRVLQKNCKFGKNAGRPWSEINASDLEWIVSKGPKRKNPAGGYDLGFDDDVRHTAIHWLRKRSPRSGLLL